MFHRTHAGAYVHFSRILPNDEKTSKKWPFFGQKLSFLASDKRLKTIFVPKSAKKGSFLVKNSIAFGKSTSQRIYTEQHVPKIGWKLHKYGLKHALHTLDGHFR